MISSRQAHEREEFALKALMKVKKGFGNVELREVETPKIAPQAILVEVKACGICGTDIHIYRDEYPYSPPVIMGHEFSGVVAEVGKNVSGFSPGDRVVSETTAYTCGVCAYCRTGRYNLCPSRRGFGYDVDGAFTKFVRVPEKSLHQLPNSVSFEEGAMTDPMSAVLHALSDRARINPGDFIVITGAGPIGLLALQISKLYSPSTTIVTDIRKSAARLNLAMKLGADVTLLSEEDPVARVRAMTEGMGADVVVEASGAQAALNQALEMTRKGGQLVLVGLYGKPVQVGNLDRAVVGQLSLIGTFSHTWPNWEDSLKLMESGRVSIRPLITHKLPITEWERGLSLILDGLAIKVLLTPVD